MSTLTCLLPVTCLPALSPSHKLSHNMVIKSNLLFCSRACGPEGLKDLAKWLASGLYVLSWLCRGWGECHFHSHCLEPVLDLCASMASYSPGSLLVVWVSHSSLFQASHISLHGGRVLRVRVDGVRKIECCN